MPTFADALKALEAVEGGSDLVAAVNGELSKLRREAGTYRTRAKAFGDYLSIDPATEDLEGALEAHRSKSTQSKSKADPEWDARFRRLEGDLAAERKLRLDAESVARSSKASTAIRDALVKGKALRPEDLAALHMGAVKYREDGSPYFVDATGAERTVDEHVANWLKDRPELVVSTQMPGPGGTGNRGAAPGVESVTRSQYRAQKSNLAFAQKIAEGKIVIVDD